jgi:hypothetical protein
VGARVTHLPWIEQRARLARALADERRELLARVPFAPELERAPPALERLARPVVALASEASADTQALLRTLGTDVPWRWLEVGVARAEDPLAEAGEPAADFALSELSEHCLLLLSAHTPPSAQERAWLGRLAQSFPEGTLQLVLVHPGPLPTAPEARTRLPGGVKPPRALPVFAVSLTGEGVEALRDEVAERVAARQLVLLDEAMRDWSRLLADLHALLELRPLAPARPGTLSRLRLGLDEVLGDEGRQLEHTLPRLVDACVEELVGRLPGSQRRLTELLREKLGARLEPALGALRERLERRMAQELARDVEAPLRAALADRFGHLVEPRAAFFDWDSARSGGLLALGAATLMGSVRKRGGWALAGAALVGGVVAGMLGKGARLRTPEELRREVALPLLEKSHGQLKQALDASRADVRHLCDLLDKAAEIFSSERGEAYDPARLGEALTQAEIQRQRLGRELEELRWKHRLEAIAPATATAPPARV